MVDEMDRRMMEGGDEMNGMEGGQIRDEWAIKNCCKRFNQINSLEYPNENESYFVSLHERKTLEVKPPKRIGRRNDPIHFQTPSEHSQVCHM